MPSCWDGVGLEPSDVVYAVAGSCPPGFDHVLARVSQRIHFGVMNPLNSDGTVGLTLSSGAYYTLHSDFWNTWQQPRLDQLQFGTNDFDAGSALTANAEATYVAGETHGAFEGAVNRGDRDAFVTKIGFA